jgi:hypothetical protein
MRKQTIFNTLIVNIVFLIYIIVKIRQISIIIAFN